MKLELLWMRVMGGGVVEEGGRSCCGGGGRLFRRGDELSFRKRSQIR